MVWTMPFRQRYLEILEGAYCAKDIMTLITGACTCSKSDTPAEVHRQAEQGGYDLIPFIDGGQIAGFVERKELESKMVEPITSSVRPLTSKLIVSADTTFPELLGVIQQNRFAFVNSSNDIVGLVTLADFNKRPVRILLFGLMMELELQMLKCVKSKLSGEEARSVLDGDAIQVNDAYAQSKKDGVDVSWYDNLDLHRIMELFEGSARLRSLLKCTDAGQVRGEFGFLVDLRNRICHPENVLVRDAGELAYQWDRLTGAIQLLDSAKA